MSELVEQLWAQEEEDALADEELLLADMWEEEEEGVTDQELLSTDTDMRVPLRKEWYMYYSPTILQVPDRVRHLMRHNKALRWTFDFIDDVCKPQCWPKKYVEAFYSPHLTYTRRFIMVKFFWYNRISLPQCLDWYEGIGAFQSPKELRRHEVQCTWKHLENLRRQSPGKLYTWWTFSVMDLKYMRLHDSPYVPMY